MSAPPSDTVPPARDERPPATPGRRGGAAQNTAITAVAQFAAMALGGLLAVLLVARFGTSAQTDALFAAYGVFTVFMILAGSLRVTMVARLVEGTDRFGRFDELLAAVGVVAAVGAIPLVALGGPLAAALVGDLGGAAQDTAQAALAIFWLATGLHLVAALGAAMLGALGDFRTPAIAYVLAGILSIAVTLALAGPLGVTALPVAVVVAAAVLVAVVGTALRRRGYRPHAGRLRPRRATVRTVAQIVVGSVGSMIWQIAYIVTLAFAARLGPGAVTVYSAAFFAANLLVAASSSSMMIALAPDFSERWDRRAATLRGPLVQTFGVGVLVSLPLVAVAALVGVDVVELVLGDSLTGDEARELVTAFVALSGVLVAAAASTVPGLAAFARSLYGRVALIGATGLAIHAALSAVGLAVDGVVALAVATSLAALVSPALLLVLVAGRGALSLGGALAVDLGRVVAALAIAFGVPGSAALLIGGVVPRAIAAGIGLALYALLVRWGLPDHWRPVGDLIARVVGRTPVASRLRSARAVPAPRR